MLLGQEQYCKQLLAEVAERRAFAHQGQSNLTLSSTACQASSNSLSVQDVKQCIRRISLP